MYKVNNTLTSAYGDMDLSKKQGPVRENSYFVTKCRNLIFYPTDHILKFNYELY